MTRGEGGRDLLLLALAVACSSIAAPLVRFAGDAPPLTLAVWRLGLAGALLLPRAAAGTPGESARAWRLAALPGVLLGVHFGTWFWSLEMTSVAASSTLVATTPVFAALLAPLLLREPTTRRQIAGVVVAIAGVVAISWSGQRAGGGRHTLEGDLLALVAALAGSVYLILGRRLRVRTTLRAYFPRVCAWGAIGLALAAVASGQPLLLDRPRHLAAAIGLALVPQLLGHGLMNAAVRRIEAQRAQLALLGEPVLSTAIAAAAFGEIPPWTFYPAGAAVLAGLALGTPSARARG